MSRALVVAGFLILAGCGGPVDDLALAPQGVTEVRRPDGSVHRVSVGYEGWLADLARARERLGKARDPGEVAALGKWVATLEGADDID